MIQFLLWALIGAVFSGFGVVIGYTIGHDAGIEEGTAVERRRHQSEQAGYTYMSPESRHPAHGEVGHVCTTSCPMPGGRRRAWEFWRL